MKATNDKIKNEKMLETIFNNTHFLIAYLDNNFNFIKVNKAYAEKHNKDPYFFIGKNHFELYPNGNKTIFKDVIETGEPYFAYSKPLEHPVLGITYWDWAIKPIKDEKNQVNYIILSLTDVTNYKRFEDKIQEEQEHFIDEIAEKRSKELFESKEMEIQSKISELKQKITKLEEVNKDLSEELETIKDESFVEAFDKQIDDLKSSNEYFKEIMDIQNPKIEELYAQVIDLKNAHDESEKILSDKLSEINSLNQRITELETDASIKEESITSKEIEIERLNQEIIKLETQDSNSLKIIEKKKLEIDIINKDIGALQNEIDKFKETVSIKESEINNLNNEILDLKLIQEDSTEIIAEEMLKIQKLNEKIKEQENIIYELGKRNKIITEELENKIDNEEMLLQLDELIKANDELEKFAETAANELQEPLRAIKSFINILSKRYRGKIDEDTDEFIDYAYDAIERLNKKIIGLLEYSRIESRGKEFKLTETEEIFDYAMNNLNASIEGNEATITRDNLPKIMADSGQILQLFGNLLENSVKFKHPEKNPRIHVSAYPDKENSQYIFSIEDNGIGIEENDQQKVFDIFKKLNPENKHPGIGLGLSLSKKIIERHGGLIWVESEPNIGSKFMFTIPVEETLLEVPIKKSKRIQIE